MPKHVLIVAYSARAYAHMAWREGFRVTTLDAFADTDTQRVAQVALRLKLHNGVLDLEAFKAQIIDLDLTRFDAVLYGSIFDAAPECLDWLAQRTHVAGNLSEVLRRVQHKPTFFGVLQRLGVPFPQTVFDTTELPTGGPWLVKQAGGCGGDHVRYWHGERLEAGGYWQQCLPGVPVSLLFYADGQSVYPIGFNRLLVDETADSPFRYAGAVSRMDMPGHAAKTMLQAAVDLTKYYQLNGLNSLDAVLVQDAIEGAIYVLELNPRMSASAHLYPDVPLIGLQLGLQAPDVCRRQAGEHKAHAEWIVYANRDWLVPTDFVFPPWVADVPGAGQCIPRCNPVCTVLADAGTHNEALALLWQRRDQLTTDLEL